MAIVNELVTKFSYQGTTAPINNYTNSLDSAFSALTRFPAIAGAAAVGIGAMVLKTVDHIDALDELSTRINVSTDSLQTLGYVAQMNDSTYEAMESSLEGLNRQIGLAANGGKMQADVFNQLGISIKDNSGHIKTADVVFVEMQQRMQALGYGTQQTAGILRKLRLDPTIAATLNLTTDEMEKYTKEALDFGIITKDQIAEGAELSKELDRMKFRLSVVSSTLSLSFGPAMKAIMAGIINTVVFIRDFVNNIEQLITNIYKAIDATIGWKAGLAIAGAAAIWFGRTALMVIVDGFKTLGLAMLLNPITWFVAGIVVLALAVEDLYQAFTGGESVIGDFFASLNIDIINSMIDGFNGLIQFLVPIGLGFIGLGLIIAGVAKTSSQFLNMFGASINTSGIDAITKKLSEQSIYMQGIATGDKQFLNNRATDNGSAYMPSAPIPQGAKQVVGANVQNTVNITGVSDPHKAAALVGNELQKQTKAAVAQKANGGR